MIFNGATMGAWQRPGRMKLSDLKRSFYALFFQLPGLPERALAARDFAAIRTTFRGPMSGRPERFTKEDIRIFKEAIARPGALTGVINYYRAQIGRGGFKRMAARGFPVIETPMLMIWGEDDPVLIPSTTDGASNSVKDLTLRFLPGVGHWVPQEATEEVNEMLTAWLAGKPVPGSATVSPGYAGE